ncbi:NACHT domain-containing protein [Streptomyces sp. NPDC086554]|uniref:NACHT domain-containing protein n=1 Tax=Streptomyces sp. NPDC086554 TaxID=3154864 RepID=UPI00341D5BA7
MSKKTNLGAGRQTLRKALRELEQAALQGRDRTEAIAQANRWLEQSGLAVLRPTTVGGWFEGGSPAKDFRSLWALVRVLLEWTGQPPADLLGGPARGQATARWIATEALWKNLWEQARETSPRAAAPANSPLVAAYLKAALNAATQHPYPGELGVHRLPPVADVYVRQQARAQEAGDPGSPSPGDATESGDSTGSAVPAAEVFRDGTLCVLVGRPGGGKSTLLRAHLASSAESWLGGRGGKTIPVMVSVAALTGSDSLPTALAKAVTGDLRRVGLLDELTADFFRHPPRAGVSWLVLVDGVDEIPNAATRVAVLTMLASAVSSGEGLYQCVVATRPLPEQELGALGGHTPRYELQPFSHKDLFTYATRWFQTLDGPGRHARVFLASLNSSRLGVLARTPLMAFMLCQLYAADPSRHLPEGRSGVYQSFLELLYEQNSHKQVASTQDKAIRELRDRYQILRDNEAVEQAAQRVRYHLPDLIDYLAYEKANGNPAPAVKIIAAHPHGQRPDKVKELLWNAFLEDLLRPTGLLTQRAGDFDFLHQTLLEYHAARHATRDEQTRTQLLHSLISPPSVPSSGRLEPPDLDASYLGFLLDGLLAPQDRITAETIRYMEALTEHGGYAAYLFLTTQVELRTNLPPGPTAGQLARFASAATLGGVARVQAARYLAQLDGYRNEAVGLLADLGADTTLSRYDRDKAVRAIVAFGDERAAGLLAHLANDTTLSSYARGEAARALVELGDARAAGLLATLAADRTLDTDEAVTEMNREKAVQALGDLGDARAAGLLTRLANDTTISCMNRVVAATALSKLTGHEKRAAGLLTHLANDTTLDSYARVQAARDVAKLDGLKNEAAEMLIAFTADTTQPAFARAIAAGGLGDLGDARAAGLLAHLANDTTLAGNARKWAADSLARLGDEQRARAGE